MIKEKRIITSEYLSVLDNEIELIPLTFDIVFKGVFSRNIDLLKRFLNEILNLELDVKLMKVRFLNTELTKQNKKEYQKRIDLYVCINGNTYIEIEINRSNFERVKLRNYLYGSKVFSMLIDTGESVSKLEDMYFIQLNLNTKDKSLNYGEDVIVRYSLTNECIYMEQDKIFLKFLEYYRNLYYTDIDKLDEGGVWLAGLTSTTFVELFDIYSHILNDDELTKLLKDVIDMSMENFNIHEWNKEKMDELVKYNHYKDGKEVGFESGLIQGKKETLNNTVKEMIKNNASIEFISKVTKLSNTEIKKIEESMD